MRPVNVRMILAQSGRYAIMARIDEESPWVQIESILGQENAARHAEDMDNDDAARAEAIRDGEADSNWGTDAPPSGWDQ